MQHETNGAGIFPLTLGTLPAMAASEIDARLAEAFTRAAERAARPKTRQARATATGVWHSWPVFLARHYTRETWDGLPGPWPVKVALCAVCLAIPGPQDEILLLAFTQFCRARKARKAAAA